MFFSLHAFAQKEKANSLIEKGNKHYRNQEMTLAENDYRKALDADPGNETAGFNLANTLYRQNKQIMAAQLLLSMSNQSNNKSLLAKVFIIRGYFIKTKKSGTKY
jgi:Tfp pilus assembly protein PilF